jgi:ketosteroid isomerase-like protein
MSEENIEVFKRVFEAYGRHDDDALLELFDPAVELHPALLVKFGGSASFYQGHSGTRDWLQDLEEAFSERSIQIAEVRDLGERLVAFGTTHFVGRTSGAAIESPLAFVVDFRNGKVLRYRTYLTRDEALEAVGLSE